MSSLDAVRGKEERRLTSFTFMLIQLKPSTILLLETVLHELFFEVDEPQKVFHRCKLALSDMVPKKRC
jgi:hypothetical protein